MSYIVASNSRLGVVKFSNTQYSEVSTKGTHHLCIKDSKGTFKYPLTTNVSASGYCPIAVKVAGSTARIANVVKTYVGSKTWITTNCVIASATSGCTSYSTKRAIVAQTAEKVANKQTGSRFTAHAGDDTKYTSKFTKTTSAQGGSSYALYSNITQQEFSQEYSVKTLSWEYKGTQNTGKNTTNTRSKSATASKSKSVACAKTDPSATAAWWKSAHKARDSATTAATAAAKDNASTYSKAIGSSLRTGTGADASTSAGKFIKNAVQTRSTYYSTTEYTRQTVDKGTAATSKSSTKTSTKYVYAGKIEDGATFTYTATCSCTFSFSGEQRSFSRPYYNVTATSPADKQTLYTATVYDVGAVLKEVTSASYSVNVSGSYNNINI